LELLVRQDAGDRRNGAVGSELDAAEIPAVGHAVAILVDRRLALERAWILAVVQTVAVGVVAAQVDARIGRIVRTRVVAVERAVAVGIGARGIARARGARDRQVLPILELPLPIRLPAGGGVDRGVPPVA
jgi:hypothetical protein